MRFPFLNLSFLIGFAGYLLSGAVVLFNTSFSAVAQDKPPQVEEVKAEMLRIGVAIEKLYLEKKVRLVDLADGETPQGKARLRDVFNNVGNPSDRPRTMLDVLSPLVQLGYLDSIPIDPYLPKDVDPRINTFIYVDEEKEIEGNENLTIINEVNNNLKTVLGYDDWVLCSAGPDGVFDRVWTKNLFLRRLDVLAQEPFFSEYLAQSKANMRRIGEAIEKLRKEKGVLLVDFWDDDTSIGYDRIRKVFKGAGDVPQEQRTRRDVLKPLVALGYLDSIPPDPFVPVAGYNQSGWNEFLLERDMTYLYCDNDPEIKTSNVGSWGDVLKYKLAVGEWVLIGCLPKFQIPINSTSFKPDNTILLFSRDLQTLVSSWEMYE